MRKKLLAVLLLLFLTLVICVDYMYSNYKKMTILNYKQRLQQGTNDYSKFFKNEVDTINSLLKSDSVLLIHQIEDHKDFNKEIVKTFKNTISDLPLISSLYFVGNDDGVYIDQKGIQPIEALEGADYRKRGWYTNAVASLNPVSSEVYSDLLTEKPVVTLSYALRKGNKIIGVIAADLYLEDINSVYGFIANSKDIRYVILDKKKNLIVHSMKEVVGLNIFSSEFRRIYETKTKLEEFSSEAGFNEFSKKLDAINGEGEISFVSLYGYKAYGYCKIIPGVDWYIIATADIDSLIRNYLLTVGIISLVTLAAITFILYKWIYAVYYKDRDLNCFTINRLIDDINDSYGKKDEKILLFIDIQGFSEINRRYGSRVAEEILKKLLNSIKLAISSNEYIIHMRSDDFILVFKKADWDKALNKSRLLYDKFSKNTFTVEDQTIQLSTFMALIKLNPSHLINAEKSINRIQEFLDKAKYKYMNELIVFSSADDFIAIQEKEKANRNLIIEAIAEDKVVPFFQPIYDLQGKSLNKYEVLMRIKDGDGYIAPAPYIKIAEEHDLIKQLDLVILEKALKYKKQYDTDDLIQLSINLSGKEISDLDHLLKVTNIINSYEINNENIIFEITETQHVEDLEIINQWISSMKSQGFKFSIDDFGSGYASIEYLNSLSVDYVKIDGKFIKDMLSSNKNYYLVESLVKMAKAFELKIVAEFVENKEILSKIKELGIDYGQGYYLGKPNAKFIDYM